jgi:DNA polymerase III alpha subunit (gram-positive type)
MTNAEISAWQKASGIEPATGERADILRRLSDAAFDAIKLIELECSGIRDGDGKWHGSDVIGGMAHGLTDRCMQLLNYDRAEWHARNGNKREVVLEVGTTGHAVQDGDRLISINCVETANGAPSGKTFRAYFNPERSVSAEAVAAHGLTEAFLKDKPFFVEIADDLIAFLGDSPLIVNSGSVMFGSSFLNAELERAGRPPIARERFVDGAPF